MLLYLHWRRSVHLPNTLTIEGDVKESARSLKLLLYVASYIVLLK